MGWVDFDLENPQLVGSYCSYLLPLNMVEHPNTSKILVNFTQVHEQHNRPVQGVINLSLSSSPEVISCFCLETFGEVGGVESEEDGDNEVGEAENSVAVAVASSLTSFLWR